MSSTNSTRGSTAFAALFFWLLLFQPPATAVKTCYDCHDKEKKEFSDRKYGHRPIEEEDCEACHKRHGFSQQLILRDNTTELCYSCHEDLRDTFSRGQTHFPVSEGQCWDCHDPHGADKKALLRSGPPDVDDPGFCLPCHKETSQTAVEANVVHTPFADLACLTCHDAHNSSFDGLLRSQSDTLCTSCHDPSSGAIREAHQKRHVTGLGCTQCHSGHASEIEGLISQNAHVPFANGDCVKCHTLPDEEGLVRLPADVTPGQLCRECHSDILAATHMAKAHPAVKQDNCDDCHTAHSSSFGSLLKTDQRSLCEECHADVLQGEGSTAHVPAALGNCHACHEVHGSDHATLLVRDDSEMCLHCHDDFRANRDNAQHVHEAVESCLNCHGPHEGETRAILRERPEELCRGCHQPEKEALRAASSHQPYMTGDCSSCHDPHFSDVPHLIRSDGPEACLRCHGDIAKRLRLDNPHGAVAEGCRTCHSPHFSTNQHLLISDEKSVCGSCHGPVGIGLAERYVHTPAKEGDCAGCHNPHGANEKKLVTGRMRRIDMDGMSVWRLPKLSGRTADLCYTCHEELSEKFRTEKAHGPVATGDCDACHVAHGSEHYGFVKAAAPALCSGCHSVDDSLNAKHGGYDLTSVDCLGCHDPHLSEREKLVRNIMHPLYEEGNCEGCHSKGTDNTPVFADSLSAVCGSCHESITKTAQTPSVHAPFATQDCAQCHRIHAANRPNLLKADQGSLCFLCHVADKQGADRPVVHLPFEQGKCLDCHKPCTSRYEHLLTKPPDNFCESCHQDLQKELAAGAPHSPVASGKCTVCHEAHSSEFPTLLKGEKAALCGECHKLNTDSIIAAHDGFSIAGSDCQNCHEGHVGPRGARGLLHPDAHAPFASKKCFSCHLGKDAESFVASGKDLCLKCHPAMTEAIAKPITHSPIESPEGCVACHAPHVGHGKAILKKAGPKTCLTCHDDADFKGEYKHKVAFENCGSCHQVHGGDFKGLLPSPNIMELCTGCHKEAAERHYHPMGEGITDPRTRQALTCVGCHSPHSSDHAALLIADKDRKLCVLCHLM